MTDQDKGSQARRHAYTAVLLLTLAAVIFTYLLELTRLANELVCWSNDLVSLDKELQQGDVHNLVQVLQHEHGLSLQGAVEQATQQHDETLVAYLGAEQRVKEQFSDWQELATYLELLRARIRGIHDWAIVSGRYR